MQFVPEVLRRHFKLLLVDEKLTQCYTNEITTSKVVQFDRIR